MKIASMQQPHFITFEGGEGAGKTTLIKICEDTLRSWGYEVVKTREPGGSLLGNEIRNWLLTRNENIKIGDKAELLMFLAARAQHIEELIAPAIAKGKIVLCDRFNDSTIAYQGVGRGLGLDFVKNLCLTVCGKTLPDLTFFLDVDPLLGLKRTKRTAKEHSAAGEVDRIESEKIEFHQQVRKAFADIAAAEPTRFITIDASKVLPEVIQSCKRVLASRFSRNL